MKIISGFEYIGISQYAIKFNNELLEFRKHSLILIGHNNTFLILDNKKLHNIFNVIRNNNWRLDIENY